jgi:hypothetical protein
MNHIDKRGWVNKTNQIGVQPTGFFFESLNPNPEFFAPRPSSKQRVVEGVSDRQIWQGNIDSGLFSFSSLRADEGWSPDNHLQILMNLRVLWEIDPIRFFGLPALEAESFKLGVSNSFQAFTAKGDLLSGFVLEAYNNLPIKLKYSVGTNFNGYFLIEYKYKKESELPWYFERSEFSNKERRGFTLTNWIEQVEYGINTNIQHGYLHDIFFTNYVFKTILINSNGARYQLLNDGKLKPMFEQYQQEKNKEIKKRAFPVILVFVICNVFFGLFVLKALRLNSAVKQNKKKE